MSCWVWSYMCYLASWLGNVMLSVKFPVLLNKLAGTVVLLTCLANFAAQIFANSKWFCCGFAQSLNADALLLHYVILWTFCFGILLMPLSSRRSADDVAQCPSHHHSTTEYMNTVFTGSLCYAFTRNWYVCCPRTVTFVWYRKTCVYCVCAQGMCHSVLF